ncbi:DUF5753 domain-containing protein [Saccharopolyspora rosea]|uniref:DUF5753 domain-containing protein n=3 Tax=Saccharopolyspora rosea TaxID=524884 RepID=A0ABW3FKM4_9PSEU
MAQDLARPVWWEFGGGLPAQLSELADAESRAVHITSVADVRVPGLLQTWEHSRALLSAVEVDADRVDHLAAIRQARQGILTKDDPVEYEVFLDEAVLCRAIGGPRPMAEQLRHINRMATRPNIVVRVIPFSEGAHTGLDGPFHLLEFRDAGAVVHLEQRRSGVFLDAPDDVDTFVRARSTLRRTAMSQRDSSKLIAAYAEGYESEGAAAGERIMVSETE